MSHRLTMRCLRTAAIWLWWRSLDRWFSAHSTRKAQDYCGPYSRPDLFYNYYVPPVACGGYGGSRGRDVSLSRGQRRRWLARRTSRINRRCRTSFCTGITAATTAITDLTPA